MAMTMALEDVVKDVAIQFRNAERGSGVLVGIIKVDSKLSKLEGEYFVYAKPPETHQVKAVLVKKDEVITSYKELIKALERMGLRITEDKYEFP